MLRNLYVLVIFTLFFSTGLYAGEVTKVKGTNALLDLKGDSAAPGDMFYSNSADGKHHGILQITKVKGDKAIAKITKGKVDVGMTLERKGASSGATAGSPKRKRSKNSDSVAGGRQYWGGMAGYAMDKMTVQVNSSTVAGQP